MQEGPKKKRQRRGSKFSTRKQLESARMKRRLKARSMESKGISFSVAFNQILTEDSREETQRRDESKEGDTLTKSALNKVFLSQSKIGRQGKDMPNTSKYRRNNHTKTELEDYHFGSEANDVDYIARQAFIEDAIALMLEEAMGTTEVESNEDTGQEGQTHADSKNEPLRLFQLGSPML